MVKWNFYSILNYSENYLEDQRNFWKKAIFILVDDLLNSTN